MLLIARAKQKAFSLIDAAIVLGIVGLVIGGIWVAAATVNDNLKQQQLVDGWAYYIRLLSEQYPKSMIAAKNVSTLDVDQQLATTNPPPAGWTVKAGGCCGVQRAIDPYGNRLYIQVLAGGNFYMSYYSQTVSGPACRAAINYIMGSVYNKLITVSLLDLGTIPACMALSPSTNYSTNKMNILEACCPNTALGFHGILPN